MGYYISLLFEIVFVIAIVSSRNIVTNDNCKHGWVYAANDPIVEASEINTQNVAFSLPNKTNDNSDDLFSTEKEYTEENGSIEDNKVEESKEINLGKDRNRKYRVVQEDRSLVDNPELVDITAKFNITIMMKRDTHQNPSKELNELHGNETMHTNEKKDEQQNQKHNSTRMNNATYGRNDKNLVKRDVFTQIDKNILVSENDADEQLVEKINYSHNSDEDSTDHNWLLINQKGRSINDRKDYNQVAYKSSEITDKNIANLNDKSWKLIRGKGQAIVKQNIFDEPVISNEMEEGNINRMTENLGNKNGVDGIYTKNVAVNFNRDQGMNASGKNGDLFSLNLPNNVNNKNEIDKDVLREELDLIDKLSQKLNNYEDLSKFQVYLNKYLPKNILNSQVYRNRQSEHNLEIAKDFEHKNNRLQLNYDDMFQINTKLNDDLPKNDDYFQENNKPMKIEDDNRKFDFNEGNFDSSTKTHVVRSTDSEWSKFQPYLNEYPAVNPKSLETPTNQVLNDRETLEDDSKAGAEYEHEWSKFRPYLNKYPIHNFRSSGELSKLNPSFNDETFGNKLLAKRDIDSKIEKDSADEQELVDNKEPHIDIVEGEGNDDDVLKLGENVVKLFEGLQQNDEKVNDLEVYDNAESNKDETRIDNTLVKKIFGDDGINEIHSNDQYGAGTSEDIDEDDDGGVIDILADVLGNGTNINNRTRINNAFKIESINNLTKIGFGTNKIPASVGTKIGYLPIFNPGQFFKPINDKIYALSEYLTHPNNGFYFPKPADIWSRIQQKGAHVFSGANGAIFGLGQVGGHDYPFPYRRSFSGRSADLKDNKESGSNQDDDEKTIKPKRSVRVLRSIPNESTTNNTNPPFDAIEELKSIFKQSLQRKTLGIESGNVIDFLRQLKSKLDDNPQATAISNDIDRKIELIDSLKDRLGRSLNGQPLTEAENETIATLRHDLDTFKEIGDNIDEQIEFLNDFDDKYRTLTETKALTNITEVTNLLREKLNSYKDTYQVNRFVLPSRNINPLAYKFPFLLNPKEIQQFVDNVTSILGSSTMKPVTMQQDVANDTIVAMGTTISPKIVELADELPIVEDN